MEYDALGSHARDELGITELAQGNPLQAALFSAISFSTGALLPLLSVLLFDSKQIIPAVIVVSLFALSILGCVSAHMGGASKTKAALRVLIWGTLAMGVSMVVGQWFEVS